MKIFEPKSFFDVFGFDVALAHVYAIEAGQYGEVGAVVEDEMDVLFFAVGLNEFFYAAAMDEEFLVGHFFFPYLYGSDSSGDEFFDQGF